MKEEAKLAKGNGVQAYKSGNGVTNGYTTSEVRHRGYVKQYVLKISITKV